MRFLRDHPIHVFLGLIYLYGLVLLAFGLGWELLFGKGLPDWSWWQFLLAPMATGFGMLVLEFVGDAVFSGLDIDKQGQPEWLRLIKILGLILLVTVILVGVVMYANPPP